MKNVINDLNLKEWRNMDDVLTDSLWLFDKRDKSGAHNNKFHGNFIPQIPHQLMLRYTREGDVIVDPFLGSGTSLIEAKRMNRHGIGIELNPETATIASENISKQDGDKALISDIIISDSSDEDTITKVRAGLSKIYRDTIDLLIFHPPYHDIIKFGDGDRNLSNMESVPTFLERFEQVAGNFLPLLGARRYAALVIGDIYTAGEWIPLAFRAMDVMLKYSVILKSIVVKRMAGNIRGQTNSNKNLWRYRALAGGFYIFKHEYIFIFQRR